MPKQAPRYDWMAASDLSVFLEWLRSLSPSQAVFLTGLLLAILGGLILRHLAVLRRLLRRLLLLLRVGLLAVLLAWLRVRLRRRVLLGGVRGRLLLPGGVLGRFRWTWLLPRLAR